MDTDWLIKRIFYIDYREAWVLKDEIARFSEDERQVAEEVLLGMVGDRKLGGLAIQALSELKSVKALPVMYGILADEKFDAGGKLMVMSSIYKINRDTELITEAIRLFRTLKNKYTIIGAMISLKVMNSAATRQLIEEFVSHSEYLVSYNAKRHLDNMTAEEY